MSTESPAITFSNVSKHFGRREVIKDLSFEVPRGETIRVRAP